MPRPTDEGYPESGGGYKARHGPAGARHSWTHGGALRFQAFVGQCIVILSPIYRFSDKVLARERAVKMTTHTITYARCAFLMRELPGSFEGEMSGGYASKLARTMT
jgi:hypothetical protein